jgi:hypothetical protein
MDLNPCAENFKCKIFNTFIFVQKTLLVVQKSHFVPCCSKKLCPKIKVVQVISILILSFYIYTYSFSCILLKPITSVPSASCVPHDRQFHPGYDQLHSVSVLVKCDAVSPGNWLWIFCNKFTHTSS